MSKKLATVGVAAGLVLGGFGMTQLASAQASDPALADEVEADVPTTDEAGDEADATDGDTMTDSDTMTDGDTMTDRTREPGDCDGAGHGDDSGHAKRDGNDKRHRHDPQGEDSDSDDPSVGGVDDEAQRRGPGPQAGADGMQRRGHHGRDGSVESSGSTSDNSTGGSGA